MIVQLFCKKRAYTKAMTRKPHSTSLVLLLVCIFTFWWGISVLSQHDLRGSLYVANPSNAAALIITESVSGGVYTYSGTYIPPAACGSFGSGIRYNAADGGHVSVLLLTEPSSGACTQASGNGGSEPFSVSIKPGAVKPAFDGVLLNGNPIPAQLVEAK